MRFDYHTATPDGDEGGSGAIYKTKYDNEPVCVKVLHLPGGEKRKKKLRVRAISISAGLASRAQYRLLQALAGEVIFWAHISHPNIIPLLGIYDSKGPDSRVCLVSPWMGNGDLCRYLKDHPTSRRIPLIYDIISGLEYLHSLSIVHADLKGIRDSSEIRIAIIGPAFSGKSQFIHDVTQNYMHGIAPSASLTSHTRRITAVSAVVPSIGNVTLIDTPGYDYTLGSTEQVSYDEGVITWVSRTYGEGAKLDGVIYMYNIRAQEARKGRASWLELLDTRLEQGAVEDGEAREEQLRDGPWRLMMAFGSSMERYENPGSHGRAVEIIRKFLDYKIPVMCQP
ncbi:Serine/threonine-protein kinase HT1 [Leucoagaricus sp. SymC.cos]|nr:Serine/threonine-protein kinase HT1 [Leucoagaricus sp. SymC.cos]